MKKEEFEEKYLEAMFSSTEEEISNARDGLEQANDLSKEIICLCLQFLSELGNNPHWSNILIMALAKATTIILQTLDKRSEGESAAELYQAMLPTCLKIAKKEIETAEARFKEQQEKEGAN